LKQPNTTRVLGIQSGNSVDGIDVVVVDFDEPEVHPTTQQLAGSLSYHVIAFETLPWPSDKRALIFSLREGNATVKDYLRANYELAEDFAAAALGVIEKHQVEKSTIDLVSSHGQTVHGHPHWELEG
jgi:1,6-anhydro-N-acetylmuramate kinase